MLLIGLTGGIASGKSFVSDAFKNLGVPVIDADVLAREIVEPGSVGLQQLTVHFGTDILTSAHELDRAALRQIIFDDPEQRKTVDALLHPLIRDRSDQRIKATEAQGHIYAIYAVPLLVETEQQDRFDRIIVVDVPEAIQISRLMKRDGSSKQNALAILAAQARREERLAVADDIVDNTGSRDATLKQVLSLHNKYKNREYKNREYKNREYTNTDNKNGK